jgi:hypothetical protein
MHHMALGDQTTDDLSTQKTRTTHYQNTHRFTPRKKT